MKILLSLLAIGSALTFSSCTAVMADPYYTSYGQSSAVYYSQAPQNMVRYPYQNCYQPVRTMGPQYYRVNGVPTGSRVTNYSDAPLIVTKHNRYGRQESTVVPASWD